MTSVMEAAQQRIADGVIWLEEVMGWKHWFWDVDPDTVDMNTMGLCPLAQVSGMTYLVAIKHFGLSLEDAGMLGFDLSAPPEDFTEQNALLDTLTLAWRDEIEMRRWAEPA